MDIWTPIPNSKHIRTLIRAYADQLIQNPEDFVKRSQQFNNNGTNGSASPMKSPGTTPGTTSTAPKPKQ